LRYFAVNFHRCGTQAVNETVLLHKCVKRLPARLFNGSAKTQSLNQARCERLQPLQRCTVFNYRHLPLYYRSGGNVPAKYRMFFAFTGGSLVLVIVQRHLLVVAQLVPAHAVTSEAMKCSDM
jgi:hypothetical protein